MSENGEHVEWCVMHPSYPNEPHRGPMTEEKAREWVANPSAGLFYVARRNVGPWKPADESNEPTVDEECPDCEGWGLVETLGDEIVPCSRCSPHLL